MHVIINLAAQKTCTETEIPLLASTHRNSDSKNQKLDLSWETPVPFLYSLLIIFDGESLPQNILFLWPQPHPL